MNVSRDRRRLLTTAALAAMTGGTTAFAQAFPDRSRQIRGISPFAPGSTADTLARAFAQAMAENLQATVIVDNRPGAEGVLGMQAAKTAAADGYTVLFTTLSTQVVNPHLFKKLPYEPLTDLVPLAGTMRTALCMSVGPSVPFKSINEFLEAARASPEKYSYASISATTRVAGEMVARAAGVKLLNVPYKNFGELTSDLLSGRVDMLMIDPPSIMPFLKQGLRVLGTAAPARLPVFAEVPTFTEQGVAGFDIPGWHAAYVAAGTPPDAVATLRRAVQQAASSHYVRDYYQRFGMEPLLLAGDELAAFQRGEYDKWGKAIRDAGLYGTL